MHDYTRQKASRRALISYGPGAGCPANSILSNRSKTAFARLISDLILKEKVTSFDYNSFIFNQSSRHSQHE